jgi:molybdopterin molybdotransferase
MISFQEAYKKVLAHPMALQPESVGLLDSVGRMLAEDVFADRDFPPFHRATKDGIALNFDRYAAGQRSFVIQGVAPAGMPQQTLVQEQQCLEVMTGAVVPLATDTVVMYEHLKIKEGVATIVEKVENGQNIHYKGSDERAGTKLLNIGTRISPVEIGILASVGKATVQVFSVPKVCAIATGNELVDIDRVPLPHQIRKSNSITLQAALLAYGIKANAQHLLDDRDSIAQGLKKALAEHDVLLLSGGVSKGKYDYIPEVMEGLGVEKIFHRVAQRPGKPFWFGVHKATNTIIFSFPGNPVSTFANFHGYFKPWLYTSWNLPVPEHTIKLKEPLEIKPPLTRFIQVAEEWSAGCLHAQLVVENGSGDLTSLAKADGFIRLEPRDNPYNQGELVPYVPTRLQKP